MPDRLLPQRVLQLGLGIGQRRRKEYFYDAAEVPGEYTAADAAGNYKINECFAKRTEDGKCQLSSYDVS